MLTSVQDSTALEEYTICAAFFVFVFTEMGTIFSYALDNPFNNVLSVGEYDLLISCQLLRDKSVLCELLRVYYTISFMIFNTSFFNQQLSHQVCSMSHIITIS